MAISVIYLIKAPGSAGIIFKILSFVTVNVKIKCNVSNNVGLLNKVGIKHGVKKNRDVWFLSRTSKQTFLCSFNSSKYKFIQIK